MALFDHDQARILGSTKNGTLKLEEDQHGLRVDIKPPSTPTGGEVLTLVREAYLDSMSFSFITAAGGVAWLDTPDGPLREVLDIALLVDVSVVATPAYAETSVSARDRGRLGVDVAGLRRRLSIS